MSVINWKPIIQMATEAATELGHVVNGFDSPKRSSPGIRMGHCETCYGCCWVARNDGFKAGGRILKYRCGTKEARGVL